MVRGVDNGSARFWLAGAIVAALIPFLAGFTSTNVFYIRDLSLYFWGRHLWLRRTLLSGEWPLWDPYVGAGQTAVADALHQMFLLPVLALRLIGSEALGFNLWVMLPFPCAVLGAWLFFRPRFTAPASALGAIAFTLSGPVVSTGNFPNMSWSVAAMPWVLWAADRLARRRNLRDTAILALTVAFQALAGEPVTLSVTTGLAMGLCVLAANERDATAPVVPSASPVFSLARTESVSSVFSVARTEPVVSVVRRMAWVAGGLALGGLLSAIQLLPMVRAASAAERSATIVDGVWSLHPVALLETVAPHLFGDYFMMQSLGASPWMPLVNTGREPFFYSLYFGAPLVALAIFGLVALGRNGWGMFWAAAGGISIVLAFGVYTPVYPFVRDHVPVLASFRFPVKYLIVFSMAVAAGAAAGWDALRHGSGQALRHGSGQALRHGSGQAFSRARLDAVVVALMIGVTTALLAAAAVFLPAATASRASAIAVTLGEREAVARAGTFMVESLPRLGMTVAPIAYAAALFIFVGAGSGAGARLARYGLFSVIATDLVVRSIGLNPVFDAKYLAEPQWISQTKADPHARFYVGGKKDGTLDTWDQDASRAYFNPPGLRGSASRAALNNQAAFYPSGWHGREMLSYDLAVLWPKLFDRTQHKFFEADEAGRDLFLKRTGVRYRVLPARVVTARTPLLKVPYFVESSFYDWGGAMPRAAIVPTARVVADPLTQVRALFTPDWDARTTVLVDREADAAGDPANVGPDVMAAATIEVDKSNRVSVRVTVPSAGGYLLLLDSYAEDWQVTVDGRPATLMRANGLFRAVRVTPGSHVVDFVYRPRAFLWGAVCSGVSALLCLAFVSRRVSR